MPHISPQPPAQSVVSCAFGDADMVCHCPTRQRTGPLTKLFGKAPPCMLVGAFEQAKPLCPDFKLHTGASIDSFFDQVETYRAENPEDGS